MSYLVLIFVTLRVTLLIGHLLKGCGARLRRQRETDKRLYGKIF